MMMTDTVVEVNCGPASAGRDFAENVSHARQIHATSAERPSVNFRVDRGPLGAIPDNAGRWAQCSSPALPQVVWRGLARKADGAGEGNRTLVVSLGSFLSAIEIHPRRPGILRAPAGPPQRGGTPRPGSGRTKTACGRNAVGKAALGIAGFAFAQPAGGSLRHRVRRLAWFALRARFA